MLYMVFPLIIISMVINRVYGIIFCADFKKVIIQGLLR